MFLSPYAVDTNLFESPRVRWCRADARAWFGIPDDQFDVLFSEKLNPPE
jgi:hypothetical protein